MNAVIIMDKTLYFQTLRRFVDCKKGLQLSKWVSVIDFYYAREQNSNKFNL